MWSPGPDSAHPLTSAANIPLPSVGGPVMWTASVARRRSSSKRLVLAASSACSAIRRSKICAQYMDTCVFIPRDTMFPMSTDTAVLHGMTKQGLRSPRRRCPDMDQICGPDSAAISSAARTAPVSPATAHVRAPAPRAAPLQRHCARRPLLRQHRRPPCSPCEADATRGLKSKLPVHSMPQ